MKTNPLLKKLRGYQRAPRDRFLLLFYKVFAQEELALYELGIAITDWDSTHIDTYGTFKATNKQIANILGWKNDSSVSRYKKSLIKKGYFKLDSDGRIQIKGFNLWELRQKKSAENQEKFAELQTDSAKIQESSEKLHKNQSYLDSYSLVSSKGGNKFLRSDREYEEIKKELGLKVLTTDDMKWIDLNVKENPDVPS